MILKFVVACSESTAKNLEFDQFWAEVCRSLGECSDQEVAGLRERQMWVDGWRIASTTVGNMRRS